MMNAVSRTPIARSTAASRGRALESDPSRVDVTAVLRTADRARAAGDLERAFKYYTRAVDHDPNLAEAWAGRAATTSDLDVSIVSWGYAVALQSDDESLSILSACITEKLKQTTENVRSLVTLGRKLAQAGQRAAARRLLVRATEMDSTNEQAWVWRAGVSADQAETIACLKQVLELNPRNAQARAGMRWAESQERRRGVLSTSAQQAAAVFEAGQSELRNGDRARAYALFSQATELDPLSASAWFWRGSTSPTIDEALNCMNQLLAIDPEDEEAKDTRWWLRIQKLRGRSQTVAEQSHAETSIQAPPVRPHKPYGQWPALVAALIVLMVVGLAGLLVVFNALF